MKSVLLLAVVAVGLSLACGGSTVAAGPCSATCDCKQTSAPVKCPGEWQCVSGTCEYKCQSQCSELPHTCAASEPCNGSICSARTGC